VFEKKYTTLNPSELVHVLAMEARCEEDAWAFEEFKERLARLRQQDAEAALAAPSTESSSHHFTVAPTVRPHVGQSAIPPRLPFPPAVVAEAPAPIPVTALLTPRGIDCPPPTAAVQSSSVGRPQPFRVPMVLP
jgi:hypothetical protein